MKFAFIIPAVAWSVLLQAELLDLNPLITIMADAPVYAIFVWLFFLQQKQNNRLLRAIIQMATKTPPVEDEV